jgi:hypothetical protein
LLPHSELFFDLIAGTTGRASGLLGQRNCAPASPGRFANVPGLLQASLSVPVNCS